MIVEYSVGYTIFSIIFAIYGVMTIIYTDELVKLYSRVLEECKKFIGNDTPLKRLLFMIESIIVILIITVVLVIVMPFRAIKDIVKMLYSYIMKGEWN